MGKNIIIFDLDGTLLNTLDDLADSTNFALLSLEYPQRTLEEIRNFVGNGVSKLIERALPKGKENPDFEKCLTTFKKHYSENMYNKTKPYNGIIKMLTDLKNRGCKIAVVSNKFDAAVKELCSKYFDNLVDIAIGEDEAHGIKKKPAPDTVNKVLELFSAEKSNSVYVGDSDVDIMTAKNSGLACVSVSWGFRDIEFLKNHGANIVIDNPEQILGYLDNN